jgi:hypothetical protein
VTFSAEFLEVLLYGAIVAVGLGLSALAVVFIADSRGKRLW